ncbi:MAG: MerR family DNA-binding transcriptional regulator [Rhodospirillaceae bacterium]|nr:MerR family DNA-binding transcriptional regulator [Rhodospirillaceae bacterium]
MTPARLSEAAPVRNRFYSTAQLAAAAGVTPRTVRFYESRGLLDPQRVGAVRVYTYSDKARLQLILRGKRLGFSLNEIGDYLDLYGADPEHIEQLNHIVSKSRDRIAELEGKLKDLHVTIKELRQIEHDALTRLKTKRGRTNAPVQRFTSVSGDKPEGRAKP